MSRLASPVDRDGQQRRTLAFAAAMHSAARIERLIDRVSKGKGKSLKDFMKLLDSAKLTLKNPKIQSKLFFVDIKS